MKDESEEFEFILDKHLLSTQPNKINIFGRNYLFIPPTAHDKCLISSPSNLNSLIIPPCLEKI